MSDLTIRGVDTAARISAEGAAKLAAEGIAFAGRYLVPDYMGKALTKPEADALRGAGLALLLCWETTASRAKEGVGAGKQDGTRAKECAEALGVPAGTVVYYAVDYDAGPADFDGIEYYLRAAAESSAPYAVGVYGSYRLVEEMHRRVACTHFWQCCAWSYGALSEHANVYQMYWSGAAESVAIANQVGFAVDVDYCADMVAAGFWLPGNVDDISGHWAADSIRWCIDHGLMQGYPDGSFQPDKPVTRAELATVLRRLCAGTEETYDPERTRLSGLLSDD